MKTTKREYTMSNADLGMLASNLVVYMTRDAVQFATRGVIAATITAFEALGNAFDIFPTDEYYVGMVKGATESKNLSRSECTALVQLISGFFEQEYGVNSEQYTQLRVKGFLTFTDNNFLVTCRAVVSVATEYLATLSTIGLTQTNIDDLDDKAQEFEENLNLIASKKALRDSKAKERTSKGNELYSFCAKYSKIGKLIWENVDEAKYNDYIIYPRTYTGLPKPQNVVAEYDPLAPPDITLSWDAVDGATSYEIYYDITAIGSPASSYQYLNTFSFSPALIPSILARRNYFKIKAKADNKSSDYSDEAFVDVLVQ